MYIIVAYDVSVERVNKVKAYLRTQLTWVQNSLFEGELTESRLMDVKKSLKELIKPEEDNVIIYIAEYKGLVERISMGVSKGDPSENIL